ncbi:hypothetical protein Gpo141_00014257 [Globisporangium polare]
MEYFDSHELFDGGQPCGVVVVDRVEDDEQYPYTPQERMRKDISGAIVLRPHWRAKPVDQGGMELVVSLSIGKYKKLHGPQRWLATPESVGQIRESITGWDAVMITMMRQALYRNAQKFIRFQRTGHFEMLNRTAVFK